MDYLEATIEDQWRASQPKMCQEQDKKGLLRPALEQARERMSQEMVWLIRRGMQHWQAAEIALANVSLPSEEQQDTLTPDQQLFTSTPTDSSDSNQEPVQPRVLSHQEFMDGLPNFQGIRIGGKYFPNLKLKK